MSIDPLLEIRRRISLFAIAISLLCVDIRAQDCAKRHIPVRSKWTFLCPQPGHRSDADVLLLTLTLNNMVWLKIESGNVTYASKLEYTEPRNFGTSKTLRLEFNQFRYRFRYDEIKNEMVLTINEAEEEDSGQWKCYVGVRREFNGKLDEEMKCTDLQVGNPRITSTTPDEQPNEHAEHPNAHPEHLEFYGGEKRSDNVVREVANNTNSSGVTVVPFAFHSGYSISVTLIFLGTFVCLIPYFS